MATGRATCNIVANVTTTSLPTDFSLPTGDYISPNLQVVWPDAAFPHMIVGDTRNCGWPHLRRQIPHNWYVDRREPGIGFCSRDEAILLYNIALAMHGANALEIGCWLGWSTCHIALGGVSRLDVIDPALAQKEIAQSVGESLHAAGVLHRVNPIGGRSPDALLKLTRDPQRKWELIFIDGDHEDPGPILDALACEPAAADEAMVVFHDLASPDVARGLDHFHLRGWRIRIYQTMQIMGVAWRGNVNPPEHQPDPSVAWPVPEHLRKFLR